MFDYNVEESQEVDEKRYVLVEVQHFLSRFKEITSYEMHEKYFSLDRLDTWTSLPNKSPYQMTPTKSEEVDNKLQ